MTTHEELHMIIIKGKSKGDKNLGVEDGAPMELYHKSIIIKSYRNDCKSVLMT